MKQWIVGVNGVDVEVRADGLYMESDNSSPALFFYVKESDSKNRNVAVFPKGKWEYFMEEAA